MITNNLYFLPNLYNNDNCNIKDNLIFNNNIGYITNNHSLSIQKFSTMAIKISHGQD